MSNQQDLENNVLAAVSQFLIAIEANKGEETKHLALLTEATSSLPLNNMERWELIIRSQTDRAQPLHKRLTRLFWFTPPPCPMWVDLCNGDGFKRERALLTLSGGAPNSFFLAVAIRRLNDWVPQVRTAARETLLSIAKASKPEDVVAVLCSILPHWNSWGRMTEADQQLLLDIASIEAVHLQLQSHLLFATAGPLPTLLTQLSRTPLLDAALPTLAHQAIQPTVRATAYKALLEGKITWLEKRQWAWTDSRYCKGRYEPIQGHRPLSTQTPPIETTLSAAIADRSALVRAVAGRTLIQKIDEIAPHLAIELANTLARDKRPSLAARGQFLVNQMGGTAPNN